MKISDNFVPVFVDDNIVISAVNGTQTISDSNNVFTGGIDNQSTWGVKKEIQETPSTPIRILKIKHNINFRDMFALLGGNLDELSLLNTKLVNFVSNIINISTRNNTSLSFFLKEKSGGS